MQIWNYDITPISQAKKIKREMSNYEELNRIYGEAETEFIYDSFSLPHTANAPCKEMGSTVNEVTHNVKEKLGNKTKAN